jgi:hypothetical protein
MTTASRTPCTLPDEDVNTVKKFLTGCAFGYIGMVHANRASSPLALDSYRAALRAYPDNPRITKLLLVTLMKSVAANDYRDERLGKECVELFFAVANHDPSVLLADTSFDLMEILSRFDLTLQLTSLIDDWYGFARAVIKVRHPPACDEVASLTRLFRYQAHFPGRLARMLTSWSKADAIPEVGCVLDAKLIAAMYRVTFDHSSNHLDPAIVPTAYEEEIASLRTQMEQIQQSREEEIANLRIQIEQIQRSRSWRITAPIRLLTHGARGILSKR